MIKLILSPLLCISNLLNAAPPVTYQFSNGTTIEASQVNGNYQELADRIEILQNQITSLQNIQQKQLVGFTAAVAISRNPLRMTAQCQTEYPNTRVCTAKEVMETIDLPVIPDNVIVRVVPDLGLDSTPGSAGYSNSIYLGAELGVDSLSCLAFSTGTATTDSKPFLASCNAGFKIACCR